MPILRIPTPLRAYTGGQNEINLPGETIVEILEQLKERYPELTPHLFNEQGELRNFINLFLGEENITDLQGLQTALKKDDRLLIIPNIAGGC